MDNNERFMLLESLLRVQVDSQNFFSSDGTKERSPRMGAGFESVEIQCHGQRAFVSEPRRQRVRR
jgi:hypothetical protein